MNFDQSQLFLSNARNLIKVDVIYVLVLGLRSKTLTRQLRRGWTVFRSLTSFKLSCPHFLVQSQCC